MTVIGYSFIFAMDRPQSKSLGSNEAHTDYSIPEEKYDPKYAKLYQAVRSGNLEATREFLIEHPEAVTARISTEGKLPLHVAALFGHLHIVKELLQRMSVEDVALPDFNKLTALHEATYGSIDVAECLIENNSNLLTLPNKDCMIPVTRALGDGRMEMVRYLYSVTPKKVLTPEYGKHGAALLNLCYYSKLLDIALDLLDNCPILAITPDHRGETFLEALGSVPSAFPSGCQLSFWQRWIYDRINIKKEQLRTFNREVQHKTIQPKSANKDITVNMPPITASRSDNMIRTMEKSDNTKVSSVQFRQARVFNLIHGMIWKNAIANLTDDEGNSLLHMAGLLAPSTELHDISGAALQMQRELQWFKEVESITPPWRVESPNREEIRMTPRQLFTENHKELVKEGEKWMKGTTSSCSLVAALVATVVFAAAFTIPGGNDQNSGYPIFSKKKGFMVFMISDAVSLISSSTSILMFLGILTSRYAERDFLTSLPTKLIVGLLTLFISMASMLVAFCATLFVMFHGKLWIVIPVSIIASVPVFSFGWYQFPLLLEMTMSTYWSSIFDRNVEPWPN